MELTYDRIRAIAAVAAAANVEYRHQLGQSAGLSFDKLSPMAQDGICNSIRRIADGELTTPQQSHDAWRETRRLEGWIYGETENREIKTHPDMVHFASLPPQEQYKTLLFINIVKSLLGRFESGSAFADLRRENEELKAGKGVQQSPGAGSPVLGALAGGAAPGPTEGEARKPKVDPRKVNAPTPKGS